MFTQRYSIILMWTNDYNLKPFGVFELPQVIEKVMSLKAITWSELYSFISQNNLIVCTRLLNSTNPRQLNGYYRNYTDVRFSMGRRKLLAE